MSLYAGVVLCVAGDSVGYPAFFAAALEPRGERKVVGRVALAGRLARALGWLTNYDSTVFLYFIQARPEYSRRHRAARVAGTHPSKGNGAGGAGNTLDLTAVGKGVSAVETLFISTYLVGVTTFAEAGRSKFARYSAEAAGDESEHRLIGQTLARANPPNNLAFEEFLYDNVGDIGAAAEKAGFGFGQQGTAAGRFYEFPNPPMAPSIQITSTQPA